jgi:hypothetical protein
MHAAIVGVSAGLLVAVAMRELVDRRSIAPERAV